MVVLRIENLPDELYCQLQSLADANKVTLNEAVIFLLNQALQSGQPEIAQEYHNKPTSEILQSIRSRPRTNPIEHGVPDSTVLIREDRDR